MGINLKKTFKIDLKRMSFKHKNNKALYYLKNYFLLAVPQKYHENKLNQLLSSLQKDPKEKQYILDRVNYYNKLNSPKELKNSKILSDLKVKDGSKTYFFDFYESFKYFKKSLKVNYVFGDVTQIPNEPSFLKSRPINGDNKNSVLLKLNKVRHFIFIKKEKYNFLQKKDSIVFRGRVRSNLPNRIDFLEKYINHPLCNIGDVNKRAFKPEWKVSRMTIDEQLAYKFILSLEGNDVASNLKWIMSSQSVAVMPKPKFETWFMEGTLIPNYHYIEIKDDFSDLEEVLKYYILNPNKAQEIVKNANEYVSQFKNKEREKLISLLVLEKYFKKTNQL